MDGRRFDILTKTLATGVSRRAALRTLVGGVPCGVLAVLGVREGSAQTCREAGRPCSKNANCCSGVCDTTNPDPFKRNRCVCPPGTASCRGLCVNLQNDEANCGTCGKACGSGSTCLSGGGCPAPRVCGSVCCSDACDIDASPQPVCCVDEQVAGDEGAGTAFCCPGTQIRCGDSPSTGCVASDQSCVSNADCATTCASLVCAAGVCCSPARACTNRNTNVTVCCEVGSLCVPLNGGTCVDARGLAPRNI
jgi:hypothetical protein